MYFIGDIKIIIEHIAVKCIKHFFKYMINASQWNKKSSPQTYICHSVATTSRRILRLVLQVTQVLYSHLHL